MTVALIAAAQRYVGLSTDTKPLSPSTGAVFYETDAGARYAWDGSAWQYVPRMEG